MGKRKRGAVIADLHSGHLVGLTPPRYQLKIDAEMQEQFDAAEIKRWEKWARIEKELWDEYTKLIRKCGPIDFLIVNGDSIDGRGSKSGGTELITTDRDRQAWMAADAIARWGAKSVTLTYGTDYHTGSDGEDWENVVADRVEYLLKKRGIKANVKIGAHEWLDANGLVLDVKHQIGTSQIPHGRHTAIAKDHLWNQLWAERELQPKSHVILRAHCHYFGFCGGKDWLGISSPALQAMGSKFGARKMSGLVDWGIVMFDIESKDSYTWWPEIIQIKAQKAKAVKI